MVLLVAVFASLALALCSAGLARHLRGRVAAYRATLVDPLLAAPNDGRSSFVALPTAHEPLHLHLRTFSSRGGGAGTAVLGFHGIGASALSFDALFAHLNRAVNVDLCALDRPGFGFTSRPNHIQYYSSQFLGGPAAMSALSGLPCGDAPILVAHSYGSIAAVLCAGHLAARCRGLVLIAPAIVADPGVRQGAALWALALPILVALLAQLRRVLAAALRLLAPVVSLLCILLLSDARAWRLMLAAAFFEPRSVDQDLVTRYKQPERCRDWDHGLFRFARAALLEHEQVLDQLDRLVQSGLPVLIIHGENDAVLPVQNSIRLADALPESVHFCIVPQCGHVPHEEKHQLCASLIQEFIYNTDTS